jgi:triacylglycerol lipase
MTEPVQPSSARWWGNHPAELRWQLELYRLLADPVLRGHGVPRGDGRPVLLMPGFGAGDYALAVMAGWLRRIGYAPHVAGFVTNTGCSNRAIEKVERTVVALNEGYGRRVALVGHSRGGHFARALGRRRPERVSHAVSIAANLRRQLGISAPTRAAVALVRTVERRLGRTQLPGCLTDACACRFSQDLAGPFPEREVRLTSIYSKGDGVVEWEGCLVPYADCVEVTGSHIGLIFNRKAYRAVGHALAAPELGG